ncbi:MULTISPECIES: sugar kinase [Dictyoglomus]|jgi:sugar/nucleoside kinase (ribokinase family)|uniref:PfkB domain protein n=1 Tax=Dictyoglomus turgidum (strain DSM 6724 / Z-1310) TaxID=515635 RepID=B8DZ66_DICTD|nr:MULTISPECIES: sugar kinase [Dictyoglomus]ACK41692.1 PfkB domain protein [Dictyoglomus turgidum DSM 6724]PNV80101.1 MAG: sugar kinase [Dictyoglomus turgidum]HBU31815.1 sugar kinase [Dictyoglomus sp.]
MELDVLTIGEILVEIMAKKIDQDFLHPGEFLGPYPSGAPAIFIDQIVKLGLKGGILGCIGEDDFGRNVFERLKKDGVEVGLIKKTQEYITGIAFVTYFSNGERKFIFHLPHSAASCIYPEDITEDLIKNIKALHIMGCSLAIKDNVKEAIHKAVNLAYEYGKLISFDPNIRVELGLSKEYLETIKNIASKSKIILSGERELSIIGEVNKEEKIIVIKKGKHGAEAYYKDKVYKVAPIEVEEVDPTGAGDCFDAGFVASILQGYTIEDALKRANIIGALSVTKRGPMEGVVDKKTLDMIR